MVQHDAKAIKYIGISIYIYIIHVVYAMDCCNSE